MSVASRRAVAIVTHALAVILGFGVVRTYGGWVVDLTRLATREKRLGAAIASLPDHSTREAEAVAQVALAVARGDIGEPISSVLHLRLLAIVARTTGDATDVQRAVDACRARAWPRCDRDEIFAMGVVR